MNTYTKNAKNDLIFQGFTAGRIAETYGELLLSNADPYRELVVGVNTLAAEFFEEAATWPPKASILGVQIPSLTGAITSAIKGGAPIIDVPESMITKEMCEIAVDLDGYNIGQIPPARYTEALMLKALENGASLQAIPARYQTENIRITAVEKSWSELKFIPAADQSEAVKLAAVKSSGHALKYIPVERRSDEVLLEAVKSQPMSLEHIPDHQQTDEIMLEAVSRRSAAIQFIPKDDQSDEVLIAAFSDKSFSPASLGHGLRDDYRKFAKQPRRFERSDELSM